MTLSRQRAFQAAIGLGLLILGAWGIQLPGTDDVENWLRWMDLVHAGGLAQGYTDAQSDYPPGTFAGLWLIDKASTVLRLPEFLVLKASIVAAAVVAVVLFRRITGHGWLALAFGAALLISGAQSYLDMWFLPLLLLSLWCLERERLVAAGFLLSAATLIKWQPLVLVPVFVMQACALHRGTGVSWRDRGTRLARLAAGASLPLIAILQLVPLRQVLLTIGRSPELHSALSYQALNLNWMVQYYLYHRGMNTDPMYFQQTFPPALITGMRLAFLVCSAALLVLFWSRPGTVRRFLWFALAAAYTYCVVNVGVHENHFFMAMAIAFVLAARGGTVERATALFVAVAANLNLALFYGLDGAPIAQAGLDPFTLTIAAANTAFLLFCWVRCACDTRFTRANTA